MKDEVEKSISWSKGKLNILHSMVTSPDFDRSDGEILEFRMPVESVTEWTSSASFFLDAASRYFVIIVIAWSVEIAEVVTTMTPKYDHCVTDDFMNLKVAKQAILAWKYRDSLPDECVTLYQALACASRLHTTYSLEPPLKEDAELLPSIKTAEASFNAGRLAVDVTGAIAILAERKDADQQKELNKLYKNKDKWNRLPKAVATAWYKLVPPDER